MNRFQEGTKKNPGLKRGFFILGMCLLAFSGALLISGHPVYSESRLTPLALDDYVVIGWNDLGMHCINPSFNELALLPPFNNLWAQVIQRGDPPKIVTSGVSLDYSIAGSGVISSIVNLF